MELNSINYINSLVPPEKPICIEGRNLSLESISPSQITEKYLAWLQDKEINRFLEVGKRDVNFESVILYVNTLRARENCDLLAITSKHDGSHIGNVSITELSEKTGYATYGIMIGEIGHPLSYVAGSEATLLIIDYFFRHNFVSQIREGAHLENKKARSLLSKLGFIPLTDLPDGQNVQRYFLSREAWLETSRKFSSIYKPINS
jgi:RimJ/RimL family protein N-acetyltransferase